MSDLYIKQMAVHILDSTVGVPVLSNELHHLSADANNFVAKHTERLFKSMKRKNVHIGEETVVAKAADHIKQDASCFLEESKNIAKEIYGIMTNFSEIPSADVVVAEVHGWDKKYLVVLKLNYKKKYSHFINNGNSSIVTSESLPDTTLHEAFAIEIGSSNRNGILLEQVVDLDGEKGYYLSTMLLKCEVDISGHEKLKLVERTTKQIIDKYYGDEEVEKLVRYKMEINDQLEAGEVAIDDIAESVFGHIPQIKQTFLQELEHRGINGVFEVNKQDDSEYYKLQEIITDAGFTIKSPVGLTNMKEHIEFKLNESGTMDIIIKNVRRIKR